MRSTDAVVVAGTGDLTEASRSQSARCPIPYPEIHNMRCRDDAAGGGVTRGPAGPGAGGGRWRRQARRAAPLFRVSVSYIYKALIRRRTTSDSGPNPSRRRWPRRHS